MSVIVPESIAERLFQNPDSMMNATLGIETEDHEIVREEVETLLEEKGYRNAFCNDVSEQTEAMDTVVFIVQVFIYGFVVLITLITVANIMNTISTGVLLRRKEFAMLKSVGITPRGFRKMICLESLLYGLRALIAAIPLSILISYLMNRQLGSSIIPFTLDPLLYLLVIAAVFALIGITMLFAVYKIRSDSVIETLKEEIQ